jgi:hypothetical protein
MQRPVRGRLEAARLRLAPHAVRRPRRRAVGRPRQAPRQVPLALHQELFPERRRSVVGHAAEVLRAQPESAA